MTSVTKLTRNHNVDSKSFDGDRRRFLNSYGVQHSNTLVVFKNKLILRNLKQNNQSQTQLNSKHKNEGPKFVTCRVRNQEINTPFYHLEMCYQNLLYLTNLSSTNDQSITYLLRLPCEQSQCYFLSYNQTSKDYQTYFASIGGKKRVRINNKQS